MNKFCHMLNNKQINNKINFVLEINEFLNGFIFGGYVRDLISGSEYNDFDICIENIESNVENLKNFVSLLKWTGNLENISSNNDNNDINYKNIINDILKVELNIVNIGNIKIDFAIGMQPRCDFTVNNLMLNKDGVITTRTIPLYINDNCKLVLKCITDISNKELVVMSDEKNNSVSYLHLLLRFSKMIDKGYIYKGNKLDKKCSDIIELNNKSRNKTEYKCSICLEKFNESKKLVCQTICNHNFHVECLKNSLTSIYSCPLCRNEQIFPVL
jgi:hypothetical protein